MSENRRGGVWLTLYTCD